MWAMLYMYCSECRWTKHFFYLTLVWSPIFGCWLYVYRSCAVVWCWRHIVFVFRWTGKLGPRCRHLQPVMAEVMYVRSRPSPRMPPAVCRSPRRKRLPSITTAAAAATAATGRSFWSTPCLLSSTCALPNYSTCIRSALKFCHNARVPVYSAAFDVLRTSVFLTLFLQQSNSKSKVTRRLCDTFSQVSIGWDCLCFTYTSSCVWLFQRL